MSIQELVFRTKAGRRFCFSGAGFLLVIFLAGPAVARDDVVPGSRYTSARGAALGDAFLNLPDDGASALFYQPAALAGLQRMQVEPLNLQLGLNNDFFKVSGLDFFSIYDLNTYQQTLNANQGTFPGISSQYLPAFAFRGFAVGILANFSWNAGKTGSTIRYRTRYELIPAIGVGFPLARGIVKIGYSFQWINKTAGTAIQPEGTDLSYGLDIPSGGGFSHNAGLQLTLPVRFLPSFSVVARNIADVRYFQFNIVPLATGNGGLPTDDPMSFDLGASVRPKIGSIGWLNILFSWRDLFNASNTPVLMRLVGGLELTIREKFFFRLGFASGYPSAGLGFEGARGGVSLVWYSEELQNVLYGEREVKYALQYRFKVFVDKDKKRRKRR